MSDLIKLAFLLFAICTSCFSLGWSWASYVKTKEHLKFLKELEEIQKR